MRIQSTNYFDNRNRKTYNGGNVNFRYLNMQNKKSVIYKANPVLKAFDNYYRRSVLTSKYTWLPVNQKIKPFLEEIHIKNKNNCNVLLWDINKDNRQKYVIVLHGTSHNISKLQSLYSKILENTDFGILALEYQGYEKSSASSVSEKPKEFVQDTEAAFEYLKNKGINDKDIQILGHSFGSFIASKFASKHPDLGGIILVAPTNMEKYILNEMQNKHINIPKSIKFLVKYGFLTKLCLHSIFNTNKTIEQVKTPTNIIYSKNDNLIQPEELNDLSQHHNKLEHCIRLDYGKHGMDENKINAVVSILQQK